MDTCIERMSKQMAPLIPRFSNRKRASLTDKVRGDEIDSFLLYPGMMHQICLALIPSPSFTYKSASS